MLLWVGLGNPGDKYASNRHNIGWMALDRIAEAHGFSPWRSKFQAKISEGRLGGTKVLLIKPQTFMNLSGQAVGEAMRFHKIPLGAVTVWHDELDLAPGKIRLKTGGGHAGHNGLRSVHQHVGSEYHRIRMGIGHPGHKDRVSAYVLGDFSKAERAWLEPLLDGISDGADALARGDASAFHQELSRRNQPEPTARKEAKPASKPVGRSDVEPEQEPSLSPLQRLAQKFR